MYYTYDFIFKKNVVYSTYIKIQEIIAKSKAKKVLIATKSIIAEIKITKKTKK